ncbi:RagB/SusD family nutrient uptake outer membrane protein [Spirosoma luteolum]
MMFSKYQTLGLLGATIALGLTSCTNLDDNVFGQLSSTEATASAVALDPSSTLQGVYQQLNTIATNQGNTYALEEHPSDEMMGPTRGTDWDDFGQWRKLHQHTWDPTHPLIIGTWNDLNSGVFRATQAISLTNSTTQQKAEASFLRGFYMHYLVDMFGQVPSRSVTDAADANPKVLTRKAASDAVIADLRYAFNNLPNGDANRASKMAAATMLAKMYLNRAVYNQDVASPAGPYTFAKADMDSSIYFANQVISSNKYALTAAGKYFDNFHWENDSRSKELIFTIANTTTSQPGNVRNRYYMTLHYNQYVSAWNGFTTLADFYNTFEAGDERRGGAVSDLTTPTGLNAGFLVGQQLVVKPNTTGAVAAQDRSGNPLAFTPTVNIAYATEAQGIRVVKYLPQPGAVDNPTNDYVFLRYADVLLMKAEALLRGGTDPSGQTAAQIVNNLRTTRKASTLATVDLNALLAERGRELYWEGWRRSDQIRFGTFLKPVDQRSQTSPSTAVLFPIPQQAVDSNPNLKQNAGY